MKKNEKHNILLFSRLSCKISKISIDINEKTMKYHRYVMEQYLQRKLLLSEVVHHIDGDTNNNNINNLELFDSKSAHLKFHWLTTRRING